MFRRITKKRAAVVGLVASLAIAGAAIAYFTTSGSGTGQATVGTAHNFSVTFGTTTGTMYPGSGSSHVPYTITNPAGSGSQNLSSTAVTVLSDTTTGSPTFGDILDHGSAVSGCLVTWFSTTDNHPTYGEIADGADAVGSVDVAMSNASSSQDGCKTHTPDIKVSAS